MKADWVACDVRARAMMRRRLGRSATRDLAGSPSLAVALAVLTETPYGYAVRREQALTEAQHAVVETAVWNLRVLAGWAPRGGVAILRVLVAGLEIANVEDHLHHLLSGRSPSPYHLGALATAWPRLAKTTSTEEVRSVLATSWWGDPGGGTPADIGLAMRTSLADRTMAAVPVASAWAVAATALLVARVVALDRRELPAMSRLAVSRVVGSAVLSAGTLSELTSVLPAVAARALVDVREPSDLWQAEARWWAQLEHDGFGLARHVSTGPDVLIAAVVLLAVDAWRVTGALEIAARGGEPLEILDAMA